MDFLTKVEKRKPPDWASKMKNHQRSILDRHAPAGSVSMHLDARVFTFPISTLYPFRRGVNTAMPTIVSANTKLQKALGPVDDEG